jgi:hypothetical protein
MNNAIVQYKNTLNIYTKSRIQLYIIYVVSAEHPYPICIMLDLDSKRKVRLHQLTAYMFDKTNEDVLSTVHTFWILTFFNRFIDISNQLPRTTLNHKMKLLVYIYFASKKHKKETLAMWWYVRCSKLASLGNNNTLAKKSGKSWNKNKGWQNN